jgi:hypothetical protein
MKSRPRILLVILLVLVGALGARIEYLRRYAAFHQREAERYAEMIRLQQNVTPLEMDSALEVAAADPEDARLDYRFHFVLHHRAVANDYQATVYHPWTFVHEPPLPERQYGD